MMSPQRIEKTPHLLILNQSIEELLAFGVDDFKYHIFAPELLLTAVGMASLVIGSISAHSS
jgi:hypothetical protein